MVQKSQTTTWDVLKTPVNNGMNYLSLKWCSPDFWTHQQYVPGSTPPKTKMTMKNQHFLIGDTSSNPWVPFPSTVWLVKASPSDSFRHRSSVVSFAQDRDVPCWWGYSTSEEPSPFFERLIRNESWRVATYMVNIEWIYIYTVYIYIHIPWDSNHHKNNGCLV